MTLNRKAFGIAKVEPTRPRIPDARPPETPQSRRHGAPAGPWPWVDFDHISPESPPNGATLPKDWKGYPQSLFPNWGPIQVERSGIYKAVKDQGRKCVIRSVDIKDKLPFVRCPDDVIKSNEENRYARTDGVKVRALFLDQPTGPVLQIIGTKYNIEPFFFSSSLNRIPSRYQEEHRGGSGDHITITLPFIRIIKKNQSWSTSHPDDMHSPISPDHCPNGALPITNGYLEHELLAIHMVRSPHSSTIISFHPQGLRSTAAEHLQTRILDAGHSVYWTDILEHTKDPTFLLLVYFWYALYAWDQALEDLYKYISELETATITTSDTRSAQTLHTVHAHLLSYTSLLRDFEKSVRFILKTPNPTLDEGLRSRENGLMEKECENLLSEIDRLEMGRYTHTERLKNAMGLLFSSVNIKDSEQMQQLTAVAVRDSRAMKQVSILTMAFLPASFAASLFGMNVKNFDDDPHIRGTLIHYLETAIPLTAITIWIIVASQTNAPGTGTHERGWQRLAWPIRIVMNILLFRWITRRGDSDSVAKVGEDSGETISRV